MSIPVRMRRLRKNAATRRLMAETTVDARSMVMPYFVLPGDRVFREVKPGYGLFQVTADTLVEEAKKLADGGVGGVMLFGVPDLKSDDGSKLDQQLAPLTGSIEKLKKALPELPLFVDVCLCSYTTHGHCGLVKGNVVLNDESLGVLSKMAVKLGEAGVDWVCPSDMMDGRVEAIRKSLDEARLFDVSILTYAVKMSSAMYGPFRAAADSAPQFGDRSTYQMPASNRREARREWKLDVEEGADALLFKPALTNLDLIRDAREESDLPLFAYQVSGEYAMIRATADAGLMDFERAVNETLVSIRRAGADVIVTYAARAAAGVK